MENINLNTPLSWCGLLPPLNFPHFPSAKMVTKMPFWQNILSYMRTECCSGLSTCTTQTTYCNVGDTRA